MADPRKKFACIYGLLAGEPGHMWGRILDEYDDEHQRGFLVDSMG
jgi:hypothetical protein